jgi:thiosulfate/3-mercaptopyruvate sulfurtransferase
MNHDVLISAPQLQDLCSHRRPLVLLDCGFDLAAPMAGEAAFNAGHLPGAQYAHLDRDLSSAKTGRNGRHPLPARDTLAQRAGAWGIAPGVQVVTYDDQGGMYAARAWWLLRWLGHGAVAVLDGGRAAWLRAGGALTAERVAARIQAPYPATPDESMPTITAQALQAQLGRLPVLDARAPERWRGDVEPLDPVAGHIPGSTCRFFKLNLADNGCFKPAAQLRDEFLALGAAGSVVHQCGSGVTACHNLLAMAHAGLAPGTLYAGSWSEWCSDPARPVARG